MLFKTFWEKLVLHDIISTLVFIKLLSLGLSSSTLLTSMSKVTVGGENWLGDLATALAPAKNTAINGDCVGLNSIGLEGISCDMVSNFVCQAPASGTAIAPSTSLESLK